MRNMLVVSSKTRASYCVAVVDASVVLKKKKKKCPDSAISPVITLRSAEKLVLGFKRVDNETMN